MTNTNLAAEKAPEKLAEKRRALGRGLESLLPGPRPVAPTVAHSDRAAGDAPAAGTPSATGAMLPELQAAGEDGPLVELALDEIEDNPYQTRTHFDPQAMAELAASIEAQGVMQPIVVRRTLVTKAPSPEGTGPEVGESVEQERYVLVLGERRFRASRMAGKTTIPAIVVRVSDQRAAEMTLVENLQRQDLNCMEMADAFSKLSTRFKMTQEDIGRRAGVSREQVSNYMRLLLLPEGVIGALQTGKLTYSHARTLLHLRDKVQMWKVAQRAMAEKMSVAKLEDLVLGVGGEHESGEARLGGVARWTDPNVKAAQRSLEEALGMRVRIRDRNGRGKVVIEYTTLEDFDRVVSMLKGD